MGGPKVGEEENFKEGGKNRGGMEREGSWRGKPPLLQIIVNYKLIVVIYCENAGDRDYINW